jgi:hypothetical protein
LICFAFDATLKFYLLFIYIQKFYRLGEKERALYLHPSLISSL